MKAAAVMRDQSFHNAHGLCPPARRPPPLPPGDGWDCTAGNEAGARCSVVLCPLAQSVLTPTLQTCGQAVRPLTHDVPGRSSLSFRIYYLYIYLFIYLFINFLHAPSKLRLASHISCLCACVSFCLSLSGRTGSAVGSVRVFSNTPITNYYATATLTDAHSHRGPRSVAIVRLSSPPSGLPTQSGWNCFF